MHGRYNMLSILKSWRDLRRWGKWCLLLGLLCLTPIISDGLSASHVPAEPDGRWVFECIDCPKQFSSMTDRSLRLDSAGYPRIAYGQDHLYYAYYDGATWQYETADDSSGVGRYASLALDVDEQPHISYFDSVNQDLRYAYRNDAGWHIETVDSEGCVGVDTSITLDAAGDVHISYSPCDYWTNAEGLKYAQRLASTWQVQVIGDEGIRKRAASFVLDTRGFPHFCYQDSDAGQLWYTFQTDLGWFVESVVDTGGTGFETSLVLDARDEPQIAYRMSGALYFAIRRDAGWQFEIVDSEGTVGLSPSLALDAQDRPHISYHDLSHDDLKYAWRDSSGWQLETVQSEGDVGWYTSLALDASSQPHISFYSQGDDRLVYAHVGDAGWQTETVDAGGHVGKYADLALDKEGTPYVSYYDVDGEALKVARRGDDGWSVERVDGPGIGLHTSVALGADDRVHVSYEGSEYGELRYAVATDQGWYTETVDSEGWPGYRPSIDLDAGGEPHIGYLDTREDELRYVVHGAEGWRVEDVDPAIDAVWDSSLALDVEDRARISYFSSTDWSLNHAKRRSDGWRTLVLARDLGLGSRSCNTSLALDGYALPHIGYNTCVWRGSAYCLPHELKYAYQDEGGWHFETVDSEGNVGEGVSLAIDEGNFAHLAYGSYVHGSPAYGSSEYSYEPNDVRYAFQDATGWHIETVESEGNVGSHISLALDDAGSPHLVYYDKTDGDLIYAYRKTYRSFIPLAVEQR